MPSKADAKVRLRMDLVESLVIFGTMDSAELIAEYEPLHLDAGNPVRCRQVVLDGGEGYIRTGHFHEMCELVFFDHVEGSVTIDGHDHVLEGPSLVYLAPYVLHQYSLKPATTRWVLFQFDRLVLDRFGDFDVLGSQCVVEPLSELDRTRMAMLGDWFIETSSPDVLRLAMRRVLDGAARGRNQTSLASVSRFKPLLEHLEKHHRYDMPVNEAADIVGLSRSHFIAQFKRCFDVTFNEFLTNRKINSAVYLLKDSELSITQIADVLDFRDPNYFSRVFKQRMGATPREFRRA